MTFSVQEAAAVEVCSTIQVLNIPELLENILLYLDLRTLLCSKRVSRSFRNTMEGSVKIQKALFFKPLSIPTDADIEMLKRPLPRQNCSRCTHGHSVWPAHIPNTVMANPLLDKYLDYSSTPRTNGPCLSQTILLANEFSLDKLSDSDPSASWRRMLLLQPHTARIQIKGFSSTHSKVRSITKSMRHGLLMKDLVKVERGNQIALCEFLAKDTERAVFLPDPVQLSHGMRVVFGEYENEDVGDAEEMEARKKIVNEICGWDVLRSRPQDGRRMFPDGKFGEGWSLDGLR